jgi:Meiotically up-regulated gene 113
LKVRDKDFIISEIQRTAALNNSKPVGQARFYTETGIAVHEWCGVYWARWGDALQEAGYESLQWGSALSEDMLFDGLAKLIRRLGRFPTAREIQLERRRDKTVPSVDAIRHRLGMKTDSLRKAHEFFSQRIGYEDVSGILATEVASLTQGTPHTPIGTSRNTLSAGYVYLVKSGRLYKIGCSENHWRRKSELHKQTAEGITEIHTIAAIDDALGIEKYWHERFKDKRQHGEWFDLSTEDISAFKKRKFM